MASIQPYKDQWRVFVRRRGFEPRSAIFEKKRDAQIWAREQDAVIDQQIAARTAANGETRLRVSAADRAEQAALAGKHVKKITLNDVLDHYEQDSRKTVGRSKAAAIKILRRDLGTKRLAELDARQLIAWAKRRGEDVSPSTVGQELTYLGTALKFSGVLLGVTDQTAITLANLSAARVTLNHMGIISTPDERERRPTEEELIKIRDYCRASTRMKTPIWSMVLIAITTGMRLGEITRLTWEDLDDQKRVITVRDRKHPTKKQGNHSIIPLLRGPVTILGELVDPMEVVSVQPKPHTGRIFPYSSTTTTYKWRYLMRRLDIIDLHFHDFRHEAISRLFEDGYQIQEVALISGHRDWKHLKRYTNINPTSLHRDTDTDQ